MASETPLTTPISETVGETPAALPLVSDIGKWCVIDFETTGLYVNSAKIVEIGMVVLDAVGTTIHQYSQLVNPQIPMPLDVQEVHGISDRMLVNAPVLAHALPEIMPWLEGSYLVAHNASFDASFLAHGLAENHIDVPDTPILDTVRLARKAYPHLASYRLTSVASHLGVDTWRHHRALGDAIATAQVLIKCLRMLQKSFPYQSSQTLRNLVLLDRLGHYAPSSLQDDSPLIQTIYDLIAKESDFYIQYHNRNGELLWRRIKPQGLINQYGKGMVKAFCYLRNENRSFILEKISNYSHEPPPDQLIEEYR